ncbi:hypothetical protein PVK64_17870 [Aliivibrio sp. S4TY2]|uniref:hypothetical protein n=1 Tax=unclassified Aliivibrio TaxID=2645654 RepID=UPI002378A88B|nr:MULTISPECIES: hypothetical protein [unclassified Aliivibrio]MDD9158034.1 hypothetical protein [Aliivibrio sp. S4TY2]MDD9161923.1 hypothetical protein [Aliivibrio sp. S4TY1]MDD9166031.1 hypothetical protein [Aliivibrio sp. S4MY2]MDD9170003.1 hypothetical protein [Aliivibrio sp. S4MY4]MDD9187054.1 hypothetical protein [Aliivibrio sp. S4MY3]
MTDYKSIDHFLSKLNYRQFRAVCFKYNITPVENNIVWRRKLLEVLTPDDIEEIFVSTLRKIK